MVMSTNKKTVDFYLYMKHYLKKIGERKCNDSINLLKPKTRYGKDYMRVGE